MTYTSTHSAKKEEDIFQLLPSHFWGGNDKEFKLS